MPGITPSCVPTGETEVAVPSANPGPARKAAAQTISVGRNASWPSAVTVTPTTSMCPASKSDTTCAPPTTTATATARAPIPTKPATTIAVPRAARAGSSPHPPATASARSRRRATTPAPASRHSTTIAPTSAGTAKKRVGNRIACQVSVAATAFAPVTATSAASTANTTVDDATPVTQASARDARAPERAAKTAVNRAKTVGASESTNAPADRSMPVAARYASGRVTATGTRCPSCQIVADAGHSVPQSAEPPRPNAHRAVSGASAIARPIAAARTASMRERRATRRRFMPHRPYPRRRVHPVAHARSPATVGGRSPRWIIGRRRWG